MTINNYWLNQDKYLLQDAAYLVCGLEPQSYRADYEHSGAPIMVIRAYEQMKSHAINQSYLWEQYYIDRDDLCYYAHEFGGEGVASALGFDQPTPITQDDCTSEIIRGGGYYDRDDFACTQLKGNKALSKIKPLSSLFKKLNALANSTLSDSFTHHLRPSGV